MTTSDIIYLPPWASRAIQVLIIGLLIGFNFLRSVYRIRTKTVRIFEKVMLILGILSLLEVLLNITLPQYPYPWFFSLSRLVFLVLLVKQLRKTWFRFAWVMFDSAHMFGFLAFYVLFASLLGMRLFKGTPEGVQYFPTYADSCFNMLVLLTTDNSPDIMLPAYEHSRPMVIFFIVYLLVGVFLLMNIFMAIFYFNYQHRY